MPFFPLVIVALTLWTLGATLTAMDGWRARGVTDHGVMGLLGLTSGSALLAGVLVPVSVPMAVLAALPALLYGTLLWLKGRDRLRARYHWFTPASGPLVPPAAPDVGHPDPEPPMSIHDWLASQEERESEAERAGRVTKMFG